jgi:iron-sulfur cluster assembly protein
MLTVTTAAAEALDTIVASAQDAPDGAAVRLVTAPASNNGAPALGLTIVDEPEPTDQAVEAGDTPVFVEADVATALADKVLDATVSGDQVGFVLAEQG